MHYSIWKGLSLGGKEKNPLFKGKARRESKINRKKPFPADGTLPTSGSYPISNSDVEECP